MFLCLLGQGILISSFCLKKDGFYEQELFHVILSAWVYTIYSLKHPVIRLRKGPLKAALRCVLPKENVVSFFSFFYLFFYFFSEKVLSMWFCHLPIISLYLHLQLPCQAKHCQLLITDHFLLNRISCVHNTV